MDPVSKNLFLYKFLATVCTDESYPPFDGGYLSYTYGRRISSKNVKAHWNKTVRLMKQRKAPKEVGIYVHWPFCVSRCTYCFCDSVVPLNAKRMSFYLKSLKKELLFFADIFHGIPMSSVYFGGGTPTFISDEDLDDLLSFIRKNFSMRKSTQIYIEGSPHTLTPSKLEIMNRSGVNRLTIGVQSFDEDVLKKVNRIQTKKEFERAFEYARVLGNFRINVDLIAGLEGQTPTSFINDVKYLAEKEPDMINIYSFEPRIHTQFSRQGKVVLPQRDKERELMMRYARKIMDESGYISAELANTDLSSIHVEDRQSADWSKYNASVLGVGYGAISHAFGSLWYQHPSVDRIKGAGTRGLPYFFGIPSHEEEEVRKFVIHRLRGGFSRKEFRGAFRKDISQYEDVYRRLKDLERIGKIAVEKESVNSFISESSEYLVFSKHLYSKRMIDALIRAHKSEYERCVKIYDERTIDSYVDNTLKKVYKSMKFYNFKLANHIA